MPTTLRQTEGIPASYPAAPSGLSAKAAALRPAVVWKRMEAFTAYRWGERTVSWFIEGPGEWWPPLLPTTITEVAAWHGEAWETLDPDVSPLGYWLVSTGPYKFSGTAGTSATPADTVLEAYRRLAEYLVAESPGAAPSVAISYGPMSVTTRRASAWLANAMNNSGAGDLLRPYRNPVP
jgi:hypothetical protein